MPNNAHTTRKAFLLAVAGAVLLPEVIAAPSKPGKLLIVAAHRDDEYECAAYRLVRELGWTADQVIVTDGESGYPCASLAELFSGTPNSDGKTRPAAIRKPEALHGGKIRGIRRHYFLAQKDRGFEVDPLSAGTGSWDRARVRALLDGLLARERYDAVFTPLPMAEAHGRHRAATLLAREAVDAIPEKSRPLILGVAARAQSAGPAGFRGADPRLIFDRTGSFGFRGALTYQIVVNRIIAEHKSRGLFQTEYGKSDSEYFWLFEVSGPDAVKRAHCGPLGGLLL